MDEYGYNESFPSVEQQQQRLESLERRQARYKWALLIFGTLTMGLLGLLWFVVSVGGPQKINYLVLSATKHSSKELEELIQKEDTQVIFSRDTEARRDSLAQGSNEANLKEEISPEMGESRPAYQASEFQNVKRTNDVSFVAQKQEEEVPRWSFDEEFETSFDPHVDLKVSGEAVAGKKILFLIEKYRKDLSYSLEFYEGHTQKEVGETTLFAYPRAGRYKVRLWIQDLQGNTKMIERILDIQAESERETPVRKMPEPKKVAAPKVAVKTEEEAPRKEKEPEKQPESRPHKLVRQMPSFPGGPEILKKYLDVHLRYPEQAMKAGIEGRIYARFVVQPDGRLTDVRIMRGLGYGCDKEVLRLIAQMPRWVPGQQDGKKVPVYYTLPVTFKRD